MDADAPRFRPVIALTALAMLAFAANSVLTRLALAPGLIDPASFSTLRILSGAVFLAALVIGSSGGARRFRWRAPMAAALAVYVVAFTYAYLSLDAGAGALILFGAVQVTMLLVGVSEGERFGMLAWAGLAIAATGLVLLVSPGDSRVDILGAGAMALAGVAWGAYSLLGRGSVDPLGTTAANFVLCVPIVLLVSALSWSELKISASGTAYAVASGAVASGAGYAIWYTALRSLQAGTAATVQLTVPVIAAIGGVLFIAEPITVRLLASSGLTLGGVALVIWTKTR